MEGTAYTACLRECVGMCWDLKSVGLYVYRVWWSKHSGGGGDVEIWCFTYVSNKTNVLLPLPTSLLFYTQSSSVFLGRGLDLSRCLRDRHTTMIDIPVDTS
jgi:hypothetical protein